MITKKKYKCPVCQTEEAHSTNHFGEIYSGCRKCGSMVLYCNEPEGISEQEARPQVTAKLHPYKFHIEEKKQAAQYRALVKKLTKSGLKKWTVHNQRMVFTLNTYFTYLCDLTEVVIYDVEQWEQQYVTNHGRLHQWTEADYPNQWIKQGFYLELP